MTASIVTKTPSAQNAVALIGVDVQQTLQNIVELKKPDQMPSYEPAREMAPVLMEKNDIAWCRRQCSGIKWEHQRNMNIELLEALARYRGMISPVWYRRPERVRFQGFGVTIPIQPMGVWSDGQTLYVDWLQPWKYKDLTHRQSDILFTLVSQRFLIGDHFGANFRVIDLSAPDHGHERQVSVERASSFNLLTLDELEAELSKLADALRLYEAMPRPAKTPRKKKEDGQAELPFGTD